jgi:hypothetical protein
MKYNPRWWFQTFGLFFHNIWNVILPIDKLIFSRWLKPPTSYVGCILAILETPKSFFAGNILILTGRKDRYLLL